jgi:acetyl-CoA carboxylase biotin carboxyl carrier protein
MRDPGDDMSLTFKEVDQILRIIEEFPAAEVRFEYGDLKLMVRREATRERGEELPHESRLAAPVAAAPSARPKPTVEAPPPARQAPAAPEQREGLIPVLAPMMGVFYAAPSPDSPPFVTVGQRVSEGTDLCIIEVMKVMNTVKAPCPGTVVEVVAVNSAMVELGSAMLWIRPDSATGA